MKKKIPPIVKSKITHTKSREKSSAGTDEIKRYLGALAEDFQGRVSAISEQFLGLNAKLDEHSLKFESIDAKLDEHSLKLDEHSLKLDLHTQMIGQLMVDVQEIKTDLKQKVDRSEFARLEKRVIILETRPHAGAHNTISK
ncbi:MAG: hypothetical protein HZB10_00210 [Candidatus Yonathbacteria bacterium]|nr:hypothetical protein [Candidatus Yonathbacteria bacterium]